MASKVTCGSIFYSKKQEAVGQKVRASPLTIIFQRLHHNQPLHTAIWEKDLGKVKAILQSEANPWKVHDVEWLALSTSLGSNHCHTIPLILEYYEKTEMYEQAYKIYLDEADLLPSRHIEMTLTGLLFSKILDRLSPNKALGPIYESLQSRQPPLSESQVEKVLSIFYTLSEKEEDFLKKKETEPLQLSYLYCPAGHVDDAS